MVLLTSLNISQKSQHSHPMVPQIKPISHNKINWYDFPEKNEKTIDFLAKKFKFHPLDLEDCLTEMQRRKIDEYDSYLFIVLHFPVYNPKTNRITTEEVDIFIGQDFIVTLHKGSLPPLDKIREECQKTSEREKYFDRGTGYFLYELTSELFDYCFPILDKLSRTATQLEKNVFDEDDEREDVLRDIMLLKKNIINFRRILQPERPVVSALEHKNKKFLPEHLEIYFDDVVDKIEKLWNSLDSLKEMADTLQNANESLIGHRTEDTIKVLTVFSVIMLPLTLISGIFGMNVAIPFEDHPLAIVWISTGMVLIAVAMFAFFRWKKWL